MISGPTAGSFRHVAHMGYDSEKGFTSTNVDPSWQQLLTSLQDQGVDPQLIEENMDFIKSFIKDAQKDADKAKKKPPPPPSRSRTSHLPPPHEAPAPTPPPAAPRPPPPRQPPRPAPPVRAPSPPSAPPAPPAPPIPTLTTHSETLPTPVSASSTGDKSSTNPFSKLMNQGSTTGTPSAGLANGGTNPFFRPQTSAVISYGVLFLLVPLGCTHLS